ncbi:Acyl transferase/acyl hydrolase/lysophospholipase [Penicillium cf. griseofulvum]|uniref:Acyl transferase/acyl hydrolase/lysophospholipase n=1 Tax=Penicillium cf. griseofulvum TaxID=2972120 RepID=A0A9W9ISV1_9EURO|nr:Acyl transferase/acyl hydrolase/lysophospholipase [Penicillium cf. griseofulvum]KAJ5430590.1 Acyl transferase/acyl hydrolase/lysophospholipase [Penicillium cf. griseofulvum]
MVEQTGAQDIAVIGMACRFPQTAKDVESFWDTLIAGRSTSTDFPPDKMNIDAHYHPDADHGGSMACRGGHFLLENGRYFDAPFFSITKNEAMAMDPQGRILMENVYHAIENAGLTIRNVASNDVSVFVGASNNDFKQIMGADEQSLWKYLPLGTSPSVLSNRISWFFDFKGSSMTVDTACSSSLVAFHLGCQDLRSGNSKIAIVSGVNLLDDPDMMYRMSHVGFLSPDSICHSFDHRANGYARGEGVGTVVLKFVSDAIRDGDTIRAVVRGTGSNQDGHTPGMSVPSYQRQEQLIRNVYAKSALKLEETGYVEAHGTGTPVGDPIEARAMGAVWKSRKDLNLPPLIIGAVKSSIGHLEGASGLAGLIKAVLVLERGIIPPNLNFENINPKIPAEEWHLQFPQVAMPWGQGLRRASVSSFGVGGTNAHVIMEDAYHYLQSHNVEGIHCTVSSSHLVVDGPNNGTEGGVTNSHIIDQQDEELYEKSQKQDHAQEHDQSQVNMIEEKSFPTRSFVWSSCDEEGLKRTFNQFHFWLRGRSGLVNEDQLLTNLAYTLTEKRTQFSWRSFFNAASLAELLEGLAEGPKFTRHVRPGKIPMLGFIFTGQGAQWAGMGKELLRFPVFRESFDDANRYLRRIGNKYDIKEELLRDVEQSRIDRPDLSQVVSTVTQTSLVDLLREWNVRPNRLVGHSSGEIAAAYCVGGLSRESAWKVAYFRGIVASTLVNSGGRMLAVGMGEDALQPHLEAVHRELKGTLSVACFNSPTNITVAGDGHMVDLLSMRLRSEGVFARQLKVQVAYHSTHMRQVADEYRRLMGELSAGNEIWPNSEPIMVSSVTGRPINASSLADADYWVRNMTSPVQFLSAVEHMINTVASKGKRTTTVVGGDHNPILNMVELGPHPAMQSATKEIVEANSTAAGRVPYYWAVQRNTSAMTQALDLAGKLFCEGYPVAFSLVNGCSSGKMLVDTPPYTFNHTHEYNPFGRLSKNFLYRQKPRHDLFGAPVRDWNVEEPRWRNFLRVHEIPWVKDHEITGQLIYPGAGYVVMAIEAAKTLVDPASTVSGFRLRDIVFKAVLQIPDTTEGVETMIAFRRKPESSYSTSSIWFEFKISSYQTKSEGWTEHCTGLVAVEYGSSKNNLIVTDAPSVAIKQNFKALKNRASQECTVPVDMEKMRADLKSLGMVFGPTMRGLSSASRGSGTGQALGIVRIPDVRSSMPYEIMEPHIMHPVTMDACTQLSIVTIGDLINQGTFAEIMLPRSIKELWLASKIVNEPGAEIDCHAVSKRISHNSVHHEVTAWSAGATMPEFRIWQYETVLLERPVQKGRHYQQPWTLMWKPDVNLMEPQETIDYLRQASDNNGTRKREENAKDSSNDLDQAVAILAQRALFSIQSSASSLPPHLEKYLAWLQEMYHHLPKNSDSSENQDELIQHAASISVEGELMSCVASHLDLIINGKTDLFHILSQDGLLERFYAENQSSLRIQELLRAYGGIYGHQAGDLKVLEVGAGDGASTKAFLPSLATSLYTYTDISTAFFAKAQRSLAAWADSIEYRKFNITQDPSEQNLEASSFDLILAVDVVHAAPDASYALQNLKSLLKESGKLILVEICKTDVLLYPLVFGLNPGWWLSEEETRQAGPLQSATWWSETLKVSGFSEVELSISDSATTAISERTLMIAGIPGPGADIEQSAEIQAAPMIVTAPEPSPQVSEIAEILSMSLASPGNRCTIVDILNVIHNTDLGGKICIVMDTQGGLLSRMSNDLMINLQHLLKSCGGILWVREDDRSDPNAALITGLIRTVGWEQDFRQQNLVTLEIGHGHNAQQAIQRIKRIYRHGFGSEVKSSGNRNNHNAEYRASVVGPIQTNRLVLQKSLDSFMANKFATTAPESTRLSDSPNRVLSLTTDSPGLLDRMYFKDCCVYTTPLKGDEVEYRVHATGLNFLDVMSAMGEVPANKFGGEASGIVTRVGPNVKRLRPGQRIAALSVCTGTFQTVARTVENAAIAIPETMSLQHAAGFPIVYATVFYCLVEVARLKKGESILIHAAAGGVGQAALMLANHIGARIFATVSSESKKMILLEYGVLEENIFYSRDLAFKQIIMQQTNHHGVDVVLNSLAGEALRATFECIAPCGRFIEIGKRDFITNGRLDMAPFLHSVTFAACDLNTIIQHDPARAYKLLQGAMELWQLGVFRPTTPFTIFKYSQLEMAFRRLQSGKQTGKVVLTIDDDDIVQALPWLPPPYQFQKDATYLLSGGLGGLGRSAARWLASRGAKHFLFLSRSGSSNADAQLLLNELNDAGCDAQILQVDVGDSVALDQAIRAHTETMPPIRGCIQGAMTLFDSTFETITSTAFEASVRAKARGSWNLHEVLPKDLDFFILLSSCAGIIGNRGQGNYNVGNTFQDALAHYRRSQGLSGTSLDLGRMLDVGVIAERKDSLFTASLRAALGNQSVSQDEFHALLEYHCNAQNTDVCPQTVVGLCTREQFLADNLPEPAFLSYPLFTHLWRLSGSVGSEGNNGDVPKFSIKGALGKARWPEEALQIVVDGIIEKLSNLLAISATEVDREMAPSNYGVDSLVAIEIRNWLSKGVGVEVGVLDIVGSQSIVDLGERVLKAKGQG